MDNKKKYRLNESSQYVVDDLPKGVETKVENLIDKITDEKVYDNMSEYYHLIMADLKKFRVDTNEKIDKHYVEKGYQVVSPNMYMFERLDKGPQYLSRQTKFDKDRYFDYTQQEKIPYFEDVP